jgi:hypothetical protein
MPFVTIAIRDTGATFYKGTMMIGKSRQNRKMGTGCYRQGDLEVETRATARVPSHPPIHPRPYNEHCRTNHKRSHCKGGGGVGTGEDPCGRPRTLIVPKRKFYFVLCIVALLLLFTACDSTPRTTSKVKNQSISTTNNGVITYSASPQDVLIRTFYGGGKLGSFEYSPEISVYGDGSYVLGPGLLMRQGQLSSDALGQLLYTLVDTNGLLKFTTKRFYDVPDQNATFLQLMLNGTSYVFQYGPFGNLQESAQDMDAYHRLGAALTSITSALNGPTHPYTSKQMALLVHQDFNPDLSRTIAYWSLPDFNLYNLAVYECGATPLDQTGPNGDTGCLTYTVPHNALLLSEQQQQTIISLLNGQPQGVFLDLGQYYSVTLRPLLPDEIVQKTLAMLGSSELDYTGVPLQDGPVPTATPTR